MDELKKTMLDLEDIYSEMHSGVCGEFDEIMADINEAWEGESKEEFMQRMRVLSGLLYNTVEELKQINQMLGETQRQRLLINENDESCE